MREANIPLEGRHVSASKLAPDDNSLIVMWNDIDLYHAVRDFTADPISFPPEQVRAFIQDLVCDREL